MTISRKLYFGFGSILGILALLSLVSFIASQIENGARNTGAASLENIQIIEKVRFQVMQNGLDLRNYLLSGDPRMEAAQDSDLRSMQETLRQANQKAKDDQLREVYSTLATNLDRWEEEFAKPLIAKRHQVDAGQTTVSDLQIAYLQRSTNSWVEKSVTSMDEAERGIQKALEKSNSSANLSGLISTIVLTIGTLIGAALGVFIAYRTSISITAPLAQLIDVTRQIVETGDLDQNINVHREDEIGSLANHYRNMVLHLKEMASASSAISAGRLNVTIHPRSENDTMANAFSRMIHGLRDLATKIRDSATGVATGSSQMAAASNESAKVSVEAARAIDEVSSTMHEMSMNVQNVVKSTQMQSSSVAETSASIDQMVASIQRVADTARTLLEICQRSREEVHIGIETMNKTTTGLTRTSAAIRSSAEIIDVLGRRADEIGKIIEVIDDLAEQTNLLALNAAIEAARAGEHGLGFAVVAEEVRKLAEKSTQSTKEISDLIQGIQKEAREAVENMEKSTTMVQQGLELGGDLNVALTKISDVVSEVYKYAQQIGGATNEQSAGSTQIAKATSRLTEITQEINSTIEEQATGVQSVVRAMEKMREVVQQATSSSSQLAAMAKHSSKLSHKLIQVADLFVLEEHVQSRSSGKSSLRSPVEEDSDSDLQPEMAQI
ncbi:MAG TPA: methyl-accepting chemotaxis protein [Candidatus Acidoferrales bacterium]|nr:methyl-accepting chemotaxis protein [Candidatus Acidoferrales bacterium]